MSVKTQAYVNLYSAMGTLEKFAELDKKAKEIASGQNLTVRFDVKEGPDGVLIFKDGSIKVVPFTNQKTDIHLLCSSCQKFNDVVNGKGMPLPIKGLLKTLKFMGNKTAPFSLLTDEMSSIMRTGKRLDGKEEKELSIILSFYAMAAGIAEVGNYDDIAKISVKAIPDGEISLEIKDKAVATIIKKDGKLTCVREKSKNPRSFMIFDDLETAGALINGTVDAMSCLSSGKLIMKGFIPMLEQLNKILNILPKYLS